MTLDTKDPSGRPAIAMQRTYTGVPETDVTYENPTIVESNSPRPRLNSVSSSVADVRMARDYHWANLFRPLLRITKEHG